MSKDHYIPASYLRNFTNKQNSLFVYDKTKPETAIKPLSKNPEQICFEWDESLMNMGNGNQSDHIETEHSKFESKFATTFKYILSCFENNQDVDWTQDTVNSLEEFAPNIFYRLPVNASLIEKTFKKFTSLNDYGIHVGTENQNGKLIFDKDLAQKLFEEPNIRQQVKATLQHLTFLKQDETYPDLEWRGYHSEGVDLISSDNPLLFQREIKDFNDLRSEVLFPISSNVSLIRVSKYSPNIFPIASLQNLCLIDNAKQFAYSQDRSSLVAHVHAYDKYAKSKDYDRNYLSRLLWLFSDKHDIQTATNFLKSLFVGQSNLKFS